MVIRISFLPELTGYFSSFPDDGMRTAARRKRLSPDSRYTCRFPLLYIVFSCAQPIVCSANLHETSRLKLGIISRCVLFSSRYFSARINGVTDFSSDETDAGGAPGASETNERMRRMAGWTGSSTAARRFPGRCRGGAAWKEYEDICLRRLPHLFWLRVLH